jgi:hypothetical protein
MGFPIGDKHNQSNRNHPLKGEACSGRGVVSDVDARRASFWKSTERLRSVEF